MLEDVGEGVQNITANERGRVQDCATLYDTGKVHTGVK